MTSNQFAELSTDPFAETLVSDSGIHMRPELVTVELPMMLTIPGPLALPTDDDTHFLLSLGEAGLLVDLDDQEVLYMVAAARGLEGDDREAAMLDAYYREATPCADGARRSLKDGTFVVTRDGCETLHGLLARMSMVSAEVCQVRLERLGNQVDSVWLVRLGDHFRFLDEPASGATPYDLALLLVGAVNSLLMGGAEFRAVATTSSSVRFVAVSGDDTEARRALSELGLRAA